jgi:sphinganine-1-phosphate aldolase
MACESVLAELQSRKSNDVDWRSGRTSMYVQFGGDDVLDIARRAVNLYFSENAHGVAAFPSVQRLQTEVIESLLDLLNAGMQGDGCLTASGSESIFLALKTARDWARARRPDLGVAKIIVPISAHPAFDKAGGILGIEVVRVPLRDDYRADADLMRRSICPRTIALAGSAPQFGHGVIDPITDLARVAVEHNLWFHVDACIGALIAPFARAAGANIPPFDFQVDGVRSISADLHKYGFAAKGISAVLFRHQCWRPHYVFEFDDWPVGSYSSTGLAGTRSAATIASAWAVMRYLGKDGFVRIARQLLDATDRLLEGLRQINGVAPVCQPDLPIVAWQTPGLSVQSVANEMRKQGWFIRTMASPEAVHMGMLSLHQVPVVDEYLASVRRSVQALQPGHMGEG